MTGGENGDLNIIDSKKAKTEGKVESQSIDCHELGILHVDVNKAVLFTLFYTLRWEKNYANENCM